MHRPKDTQTRILHRLKISRGHLEKIIKMVEDDEYCIDVLHQLNAVEKGLKESGNLVMENHLRTCVAEQIKNGNSQETVKEVMSVFKTKI